MNFISVLPAREYIDEEFRDEELRVVWLTTLLTEYRTILTSLGTKSI